MNRIQSITLIMFFLLPLDFSAQFFGLIQKDPQQHYLAALNYPMDGNYRTLNYIQWSANNSYFYKRCQVLVFNSAYQLIDSVNLMKGVIPVQSLPLKKGNRLYWGAFLYDTLSMSPNVSQLVVLELDTNYNHVALHKINNSRYYSLGRPTRTNLLYMGGRFYINQLSDNADTSIIYKLTSQFSKADSVVMKGRVYEIRGVGNKLMLYSTDLSLPCSDPFGLSLEKLMVDTSFNYGSCFTFTNLGYHNYAEAPQPIQIRYKSGIGLLPLSKTKTLAIGSMGVVHSLQQAIVKTGIVNCIISNNDSVIKASVYSNSLTNYAYCSGPNAIAVKANEIITVGCVGINDQAVLMLQPQNSTIFITKIDTLGNLIWQKQYGGDFFYVPTGVAFTTDGGCLISGWRYVPVTNNQIHSVESFLLKLDGNGIYGSVGLMESELIKNNGIKCYPIPSANKIYFDIPYEDNISIDLFDNFGQIVLTENNYQNLKEIDIASLSTNIYLYRIRTKTNIYSGKFIKE